MTTSYEKAGVSIEAGQQAVGLMKQAVSRTHGPNVLAGIGAFGGLYSLSGQLDRLTEPTLVASTDGVGTKVKLAAQLGRYRGIGHDIVNHCVNDILCAGEGVQPLFFLDYVASSQLEPTLIAEIVTGMSEACQPIGCALLGGETAEMPGVYQPNQFDVVGTLVGLVDQTRLYPRSTVQAGDLLLGLPASGAHTNGYSLIRAIFADETESVMGRQFEGIGRLGEALLQPHRCYYAELAQLRDAGIKVQSVAHITGGGLVDNLPRALPDGLTARLDCTRWTVPPLFKLIQQQGQVSDVEMRRVFNMGIGMVVVVSAAAAEAALVALNGPAWLIGEVIGGGPELEWR